MEEIITINDQQYKINTPTILTQAQRTEVIAKLSKTIGCTSCEGNNSSRISTLTASCPTSPIKRTSTKDIPCTIDNASSLTPGYVYKLYTYDLLYATYPTSGTTTLTSYTFANVPFNTAGTSVPVKLEVTDSCTGNTIGSCNCNLVIEDPVVNNVTVDYVSPCTGSIIIGSTCTLSTTCKDQFDTAISCGTPTWTSRDTTIATVSSTGVVTGVSIGTARIYATVSGINSSDKNVDVTAVPCTLPTCSFTIT